MPDEIKITPQLYEFIVKIDEEKTRDIKVSREEYDRLARALRRLTIQVRKLTRAQKRTDERLDKLTQTVNRLTETVEKLSRDVSSLSKTVKNLSIAVGRLSDIIGFGLEDIARIMVPGWLERHLNIYVDELSPMFFQVGNKEFQVDFYGEGTKNGKEVIIIGECRSRIYDNDVRRFARTISEISSLFEGKEIVAIIFGYLVHPRAQEEAKKHNIVVLATYMR